MTPRISASSFYNLSKCHRRVWMDINADPAQKVEHSDFLDLLWQRGTRIEREIIDSIKQEHKIVIVEGPAGPAAFATSLELMRQGADWIYQAVLLDDDRIGRPDILQRVSGQSKLGSYHYIPCDIKSGRATVEKESDDIKSHYANQMLFYCDLIRVRNPNRSLGASVKSALGASLA